MFGLVFFQSLSKLRVHRKGHSRRRNCCMRSPASFMTFVTLLLFTLVYVISEKDGNGLSIAHQFIQDDHFFLLATVSEITLFNPSNYSQEVLINNQLSISHLDYVCSSNETCKVLWYDSNDKEIRSLWFTNRPTFQILSQGETISEGLQSVTGLAVDWVHNYFYWIDAGLGRLEVSDGYSRANVLDGLNNPMGLKIDPVEGILFWTNVHRHGLRVLERCYLDGSHRKELMNTFDIQSVNTLTLDYETKNILWADRRTFSIYRTNYEGGNLRLIGSNQKLSFVSSLASINGLLYWVDEQRRRLIKSSWNHLNETVKPLTVAPEAIKDFRIFKRPEVIIGVNHKILCKEFQCSHICLFGLENHVSCFCPYGLVLGTNNKTCIGHEQVMVAVHPSGNSSQVLFLDWNHLDNWVYPPFEIASTEVESFSFDPINQCFYWIDQGMVFSHKMNTKKLFMKFEYFTPISLAVNWNLRHLYILLARRDYRNRSVISVSHITGDFFSHLLWEDMYIPKQIEVDSHNGFLLWYHIHNQTSQHRLELSLMTGHERRTVFASSDPIQNFCCDPEGKQICWLMGDKKIRCQGYSDILIRYPISLEPQDISAFGMFKSQLIYSLKNGTLMTSNLLDRQNRVSTWRNFSSVCFFAVFERRNLASPLLHSSIHLPFVPTLKNEFLPIQSNSSQLYLLITEKNLPHFLSLMDSDMPKLFANAPFATAEGDSLDVSYTRMFFFDSHNRIYSTRMDGMDNKLSIEVNSTLGGIAVDYEAGNLYWSQPELGQISVSRLNGDFPLIIIHGLSTPSILEIHLKLSLLFWVSCPVPYNCSILSSNLSGHQVQTRVTSERNQIGDISLSNDLIYWSQPMSGSIHSLSLSKGERKILFSLPTLYFPTFITIYKDKLFWADRKYLNGSILKKDLDTSGSVSLVKALQNVGKLIHLKIQENNSSNPCYVSNGNCSHLCLNNLSSKNLCFCSNGVLLNGTFCKSHSSFLMVADRSRLVSVQLSETLNPNGAIPEIHLNSYGFNNIIALAYNPLKERLYFSDLHKEPYLFSIFPNGSDIQPEIKTSMRVRHIEGMVLDPVNGGLYWTESSMPSIWKLHNKQETQLVAFYGNSRLGSISMDPCSRKLFWTNNHLGFSRIETCTLESCQDRRVLVSYGLITVNGLTFHLGYLFWNNYDVRAQSFSIEGCTVNGKQRKLLVRGSQHRPFAMVSYGDILYWTDQEDNVVCRVDLMEKQACIQLPNHLNSPLGLTLVKPVSNICPAQEKELSFFGSEIVEPLIEKGPSTQPAFFLTDKYCNHESEIEASTSSTNNLLSTVSICITGALLTVAFCFLIVLLVRRRYIARIILKYRTKSEISLPLPPKEEDRTEDQDLQAAISNPTFELEDINEGQTPLINT